MTIAKIYITCAGLFIAGISLQTFGGGKVANEIVASPQLPGLEADTIDGNYIVHQHS